MALRKVPSDQVLNELSNAQWPERFQAIRSKILNRQLPSVQEAKLLLKNYHLLGQATTQYLNFIAQKPSDIRIAFGGLVKDNHICIFTAVNSKKDQFNRKTATKILSGRIEAFEEGNRRGQELCLKTIEISEGEFPGKAFIKACHEILEEERPEYYKINSLRPAQAI